VIAADFLIVDYVEALDNLSALQDSPSLSEVRRSPAVKPEDPEDGKVQIEHLTISKK
jgi:hypothetical protein